MITRVVITRDAQKDLRGVPGHIVRTFFAWVEAVELSGLKEVRKIPGYHDEPLKGRRQGQRSVRLSRAYRAIYAIKRDGTIELVSVEEVNKHDY